MAAKMMAKSQPRRVMLWAYPRSLSTIFELALASRTETQVIHEIYSLAYHFGEDRVYPYPDTEETISGFKFQDAIETLESDYPEKDVILCKDIAYCLDGNFDRLPKGYTHTFLIRDPTRSISSLCKLNSATNTSLENMPLTGGVKQLYELHDYVTTKLKQKSVIIDAYDLSHQPEKIIHKFCYAVEIPYEDSYLNWKPNNIDNWHVMWKHQAVLYSKWFGSAVSSSEFKPLPDQNHQLDIAQVPHEGQARIAAALPYYRELYEKRIKP